MKDHPTIIKNIRLSDNNGLLQKSLFKDKVVQIPYFLLGLTVCMPIKWQPKGFLVFLILEFTIFLVVQFRAGRVRVEPGQFRMPEILFIGLFLLGLLSFAYSDNKGFGWTKIETTLPFLILPLLAFTNTKGRLRESSPAFLRGFFLGNLALIGFIALGMLKIMFMNNLPAISLKSIPLLDSLFQHHYHRTYVGMILVSGYICYSSSYRFAGSHGVRLARILFAIILWIVLFLTGVRSVLIAYSVILLFQVLSVKSKLHAFLYLGFLILLFLGIVLFHPRLGQFINPDLLFTDAVFQSNVRFDLWRASMGLIKEKPFFGYGIGDGKDFLFQQVKDLDSIRFLSFRPDAHNQFIQGWIDSGALHPGLLIGLLLSFAFGRNKAPFVFRFGIPVLFLVVMSFEVIFYRFSGVLLFGTLLLFPYVEFELPENRTRRHIVFFLACLILFSMFFGFRKQVTKFSSLAPASYMPLPHQAIPFNELPGPLPAGMPEGTEACLLDKQSFGKRRQDNIFAQTPIFDRSVQKGDSVHLSVFCYVNEEFNGDQVRLSGRGQVNEPNDDYADLEIRNSWQLLEIHTTAERGRAIYVLTVGKSQTASIDSIHGWILFALPQMKVDY
ncbi:MAG: O-antigen ligase family protein [Bacteroidales bacterium]